MAALLRGIFGGAQSSSAAIREQKLREFTSTFPEFRNQKGGGSNEGIVCTRISENNYRVLFSSTGVAYQLSVMTTNDFPHGRAPTIAFLLPSVIMHPWLDGFKNVVGCPKLMNWNQNSSLVEVVREIVAAISSATTSTQPLLQPGVIPGLIPRRDSRENLNNAPVTFANSSVGSGGYNQHAAYTAQQQQQPPMNQSPYTSHIHTPNSQPIGNNPNSNPNLYPYGSYPNSNSNSYGNSAGASQYGGGVSNNQGPYPTYSAPPQNGQPPPGYISPQNSSQQIPSYPPSGNVKNQAPVSNSPHQQQRQQQQQAQKRLSGSDNSIVTSETMREIQKSIPDHFIELDALSDQELQLLLDDEEFYNAFLNSEIQSVQFSKSMYDGFVSNNAEICKKLVDEHDKVSKLQAELKTLQDSLKEKIREYDACLDTVNRNYSNSKVASRALLESKLQQLDSESKRLETDYGDGKKDSDSFVKEYLDIRSRYYALDKKMKLIS